MLLTGAWLILASVLKSISAHLMQTEYEHLLILDIFKNFGAQYSINFKELISKNTLNNIQFNSA